MNKTLKKNLLFLWIAVLSGPVVLAQLGSQPVTVSVQGNPVVAYTGSYALVIGMTNYNAGLPSLPGVSMDMADIKQALENQGFKVILKLDIDLQEMDDAFSNFIAHYGQDPDNRLLFYFAGHGYTVKTNLGEELGYIVPTRASPAPSLPPAGHCQSLSARKHCNPCDSS